MTVYLRKAKFRRDRRPRVAARPAAPNGKRTVVITARTVISRSCGEVTRAPGPRGGKTGPGTRRPEEIQKCRRKRELPRVNGLDEWGGVVTEGANSQARSVSYYGEIVARARDRPARPGRGG